MQKIQNNKVSFCPKISKHLHQPKMFNESRVFAHSLVIESKRVSGGEPSAFGDFKVLIYLSRYLDQETAR